MDRETTSDVNKASKPRPGLSRPKPRPLFSGLGLKAKA